MDSMQFQASITEAALEGMKQPDSLGMPINYVDLPKSIVKNESYKTNK